MHHDVEASRSISDLRISKRGPSLSHLFFADDSLLFFRARVDEAHVIQNILQCSERASGQVVNFDKSTVAFSSNIDDQTQVSVSGVLQVRSTPCHQHYLGLPAFMPRSRVSSMKFIKDRVWRKIQSWKGKLFSVRGREVLLKSVVQAIPCYTMNCFRIPKKIVCEINRMMSRFWWSRVEEDTRIHWVGWKDLCKPKCFGGLGFRDLEAFNQALLAKQC